MNLYYHVNRSEKISHGQVIELEPYDFASESILPIYGAMMSTDYLNHLAEMTSQGLSLHGARYLIQIPQAPTNFKDFSIEFFYEFIRFKYYPHLPSRFQSFFGWEFLENAKTFKQLSGNKGKIFEFSCLNDLISSETIFKADSNLLRVTHSLAEQENLAKMYWNGEPLDKGEYSPDWEYLVKLPIHIIRELKD